MNWRGLALCLLLSGTGVASAFPPIRSIEFAGNDVTRVRVMQREIDLREGDPADPACIERARQAIQDLGLFRSVAASQQPLESGVAVIFSVEEKHYLLPLPRLDARDDGEYAYGAQLTWTNLLGLNHDLRLYWEQRDRREQGVGREDNFALHWFAPQLADSRWSLAVGGGYTRRPVELGGPAQAGYSEQFRALRGELIRGLSDGPPSQGWRAWGGVAWREQRTSGPLALPAYGSAMPLVGGLGYRQIRFHRFSETGRFLQLGLEVATEDLASDYDEVDYRFRVGQLIALGTRSHQALNLYAELGARHGGPPVSDAFELGGTGALRGYDGDFLEGNAYYLLTADLLRPVGRDWLRLLARLEAGNVFARPRDVNLDRVYASLALGVRVRIDWFVNLDLDLGYAFPLGDPGEGGRLFAGRP